MVIKMKIFMHAGFREEGNRLAVPVKLRTVPSGAADALGSPQPSAIPSPGPFFL
jgi:hypothetical protein